MCSLLEYVGMGTLTLRSNVFAILNPINAKMLMMETMSVATLVFVIWENIAIQVCRGQRSISLHSQLANYSGTPLLQTFEMQTPRFNGWFAQVWITFLLTVIHYNHWNADTSLFSNRTGFPVPLVPGLYKLNSIMWPTHMPLKQDCPPPLLIQQLDIIIALVCVVVVLVSG